MGALVVPKALSVASASNRLLLRIGVRVDGKDLENSCAAYDVREGWARKTNGDVLYGKIEPYWR
jgi:hypothetical protein